MFLLGFEGVLQQNYCNKYIHWLLHSNLQFFRKVMYIVNICKLGILHVSVHVFLQYLFCQCTWWHYISISVIKVTSGWVLGHDLCLASCVHCQPWLGWVGLWGFLWWAPLAKRKDHHGVSSGWSSVWHRSNTGLSSTQYEQIPIILGVWPFWLTPFVFRSITFWRAYG